MPSVIESPITNGSRAVMPPGYDMHLLPLTKRLLGRDYDPHSFGVTVLVLTEPSIGTGIDRPFGGFAANATLNPTVVFTGLVQESSVWQEEAFTPGIVRFTAGSTTMISGLISESWPTGRDQNFDMTTSRVIELLNEEDENEGALQPASSALSTALELLWQARPLVLGTFPRGAASLAEDGGIRVYWSKAERSLQLIVPAYQDNAPMLHHGERGRFGIERHVSSRNLARWLDWLGGA